ncbi:MAG: signal peptidase I [Thaumarchaeota archaeon]|jgi:signal peptidase|nr:signal peptidase I [Nitrososphaerota archaeon]
MLKPIARAAAYVSITVFLVLIFWAGLTFALGTSSPAYVVSSGSMIPTLNVGDIIVVKDKDSFKSLQVGDIIVFHSPAGDGRVIVHRIYSMNIDQYGVAIYTKGDNNPAPDGWVVRESHYIGKVVFTLPYLGRITSIIQPPLNYILILFFIVLIFVVELKRK